MDNALEKKRIGDNRGTDIAPKVFGFAALGVMAAMFALMNFSMTIIIFLVLIGYFVWRAVAKTEMHEVRGIFEFYLSANEILRDDERRWYGFEIQDVIARGHRILGMMPDAPPLVHFALGALYHRAGNFQQAENHLAFLVEDQKADERNRSTASAELRSYVRILRKLEREPAEAPQTTAAMRALERARRHRAAAILSESRAKTQELLTAAKTKELTAPAASPEPRKPLLERLDEKTAPENESLPSTEPSAPFNKLFENQSVKIPSSAINGNGGSGNPPQTNQAPPSIAENYPAQPKKTAKKSKAEKTPKPISEILHDLYD